MTAWDGVVLMFWHHPWVAVMMGSLVLAGVVIDARRQDSE